MFSNFCVLEKPKKFRNFQKKSPRWANINPQPILSQGQPASARLSPRQPLLKLRIFDPNPYLTRKSASNPYLTRPLSASVAEIPTLYGML